MRVFIRWGSILAGLCCLSLIGIASATIRGDLNGDGQVDEIDLAVLESSFFTYNSKADLDGDGIVSFSDVAVLKQAMPGSVAIVTIRNPEGNDTVSLSGPSIVSKGEIFNVTVSGDFSVIPTLGGGLDFSWDGGVVTLTNITVTAPDSNPPFTRPGDIDVGSLTGLAFGLFDGYSTAIEIAQLTFEAVETGETSFAVGPNTIPAGPLVDFFGDPISSVVYSGFDLTVVVGQVIYVAGFENDRVVKFSLASGVGEEFAALNMGDGPIGIAVDSEKRVYVSLTDGTSNIVRYSPDGSAQDQFTQSLGTTGPGLIDFAEDGTLVAGPRLNAAAVYRFESTGELLETVPAPDAEQRTFTSVFPYGNFILAADAGSGDIFRIDISQPGTPIELYIAGDDAPVRPHGLTIGHTGNLFVSGMQAVYEYDLPSGALVGTFISDFQDLGIALQPSSGAFDFESAEFIYVPEQGAYLLTTQTDSLHVINTDGQLVATFSTPLLARAFGIATVPTSTSTTFVADPAAVAPGSDVGNAYPNVSLSTAQGQVSGSNGTITSPLELISDNMGPVFSNGATFEHLGGPLWSAGQCCGGDTVLRADFDLPTTSARVEFLPDDLDTGVFQIYSASDALLGERSIYNSLPTTIELTSANPPIAYALATYVDLGLIGSVTYTTSMADLALVNVDPTTIEFDAVPIGASAQGQVDVSNQGDNVLFIGQIALQEPLTAPFTFNVDSCSNQHLLPLENCAVAVQFNPSVGGTFQESFDIPTNDQTISGFLVQIVGRVDRDADGVSDEFDNCLALFNPDQRDTDGDLIGNRCDPDFINNCFVNAQDAAVLRANFFSSGDLVTDLNGDGITNFADLNIFTQFFFRSPGPSGLPSDCECPSPIGTPCGPRP